MKLKYVIGCGRVSVMFDAKPDERIRGMLKASGFRWNHREGFCAPWCASAPLTS